MFRKSGFIMAALMMLVAILAGCSGNNQNEKKVVETNQPQVEDSDLLQPVTLQVAYAAYGAKEFETYFTEPLKKKFPQVTFENVVMVSGDTVKLQALLASGSPPDIMMGPYNDLTSMNDVGLISNLQPLIKSNKLDLSRFEPYIMEAMKQYYVGGGLSAIPYLQNLSALFYNRDIFDKFGIAYPTDGMTWEQTRDLAAKVTRNEGGMQYRGLEPDAVQRAGIQYGARLINEKTMTAEANSDKWKHVFDIMKSIYDIPGNEKMQLFGAGDKAFTKDQTLAMRASNMGLGALAQAQEDNVNLDLVTFPSFKEAPGVAWPLDLHVATITPTSKHKEIAFKVIQTFVSDEVQTGISMQGQLPVIHKESIQQAFGANFPTLKNKNIKAVFKTKPSTPPYATKYEKAAYEIIRDALADVVNSSKDINTALRDADDAINKLMKEQQ